MDKREKPTGLSRHEQDLIKQVRGINFGSMTIHVKNGQPFRVENKVESIMLGVFSGDGDLIP